MNSKPITSLLVAFCAVSLAVPLLGGGLASAVTSALQPADIAYPGGASGKLGQEPAVYAVNQPIKLSANFPNNAAGMTVTIFKETSAGSNDYVSTGKTDAANGYGNAYILDYTVSSQQRIFARVSDGRVTEVDTLKPAAGISGVLDPIKLDTERPRRAGDVLADRHRREDRASGQDHQGRHLEDDLHRQAAGQRLHVLPDL